MPFMPQTSAETLRRMGLEEQVASTDLVEVCAWGGLVSQREVIKGEALFPRLSSHKE